MLVPVEASRFSPPSSAVVSGESEIWEEDSIFLPDEILRIIFEFAVGTPRDFWTLSLASHSFHSILVDSSNFVVGRIHARVSREYFGTFLARSAADVNFGIAYFLSTFLDPRSHSYIDVSGYAEATCWRDQYCRVVPPPSTFTQLWERIPLVRAEADAHLRFARLRSFVRRAHVGGPIAMLAYSFFYLSTICAFVSCLIGRIEVVSIGVLVGVGILECVESVAFYVQLFRLERISILLDEMMEDEPEEEEETMLDLSVVWSEAERLKFGEEMRRVYEKELLGGETGSALARFELSELFGRRRNVVFRSGPPSSFDCTRFSPEERSLSDVYQGHVITAMGATFFYGCLFPLCYVTGLFIRAEFPLTWKTTVAPFLVFLGLLFSFVCLAQLPNTSFRESSFGTGIEMAAAGVIFLAKSFMFFIYDWSVSSWIGIVFFGVIGVGMAVFQLRANFAKFGVDFWEFSREQYFISATVAASWWMVVTLGLVPPVISGLLLMMLYFGLAVYHTNREMGRESLARIVPYFRALLSLCRVYRKTLESPRIDMEAIVNLVEPLRPKWDVLPTSDSDDF